MDILEIFAGISAGVKEKGLSAVMEWQENAFAERGRLLSESVEAANAYRQSRADAVEKISQKIADLTAEGQAAEKEKLRLNTSLAIAAAHDDADGFRAAQKKLEKLETERAVRENMITALRETTVFGSEELFKAAEEKHNAYTEYLQRLRGIYNELFNLAKDQEIMAKELKDTALSLSAIATDGFNSITGDEKGAKIPAPQTAPLPTKSLKAGTWRGAL